MSDVERPIIARDGWPFIFAGFLVLLLALRLDWLWLVILCGFYFIAAYLLFRDPHREVPAIPLAVVSPVDGRILDIRTTDKALLEREATVITIKVHRSGAYTTRSPTEGKVLSLTDSAAGSRTGDTNGLWIRTDEEDDVVMLMKGDAVSYLYPAVADIRYGERIGQGERIGLNRLTKTAVLYLPENVELAVAAGDKIYAGSSVLAEYYRESEEKA